MPFGPTETLWIPAPSAQRVDVRLAPLEARDRFDPPRWHMRQVPALSAQPGAFEIGVSALGVPDGDYEYEFVVDGRVNEPRPDPFAIDITRFGGYRGVLQIRNGRRFRPPFDWSDEMAGSLPENNRLVVYEMPLRWMAGEVESYRQVALGTFDKAIFEHLDDIAALGVNAIELLPIQDSRDTLTWGYGTRFFFAPDFDMGAPVDLKLFIKRCHQRGIRVILDVVMNHSSACPLESLAPEWYYVLTPGEEGDRPDWGGKVIAYRRRIAGKSPSRELQFAMADYWIEVYHVDGFRIDEFKGIDNWEFVQEFREHAWETFRRRFPTRPFIVIAEDSWRRAVAAKAAPTNPNGRQVVDGIWNFAFRDEARRILTNQVQTIWQQPSRRQRIEAAIGGRAMWDALAGSFKDGFDDLAQAVNYITSHDVERDGERRFVTEILGALMRIRGLGDGSIENVRYVVNRIADQPSRVQQAHQDALDRARSGFALLLTSVGMPMFLAGEEFGDLHDLDTGDPSLKMSDPVDWSRRQQPGHRALWDQVRELVTLRTSHAALQRNEVTFFYWHPRIDDNASERVFAYCRTAGRPLGSAGQVAAVVNAGPDDFPSFDLGWPWSAGQMREHAVPAHGGSPTVSGATNVMSLSLAPFEARVFAS